METSKYNREREEERRGSGEKKKSLRSRLGKPMFTDQHWLHGHQAWGSEK